MYDLPKHTDFEFLRDQELALLCFGPYSVTLHFDNRVQIQIEGSFQHVIDGHDPNPETFAFPIKGSQLMRLLMQRVTKIKTKRDGTLRLAFSNGDTLFIAGNVGPNESYNVHYPDGFFVV
jgi:hypothetical protein